MSTKQIISRVAEFYGVTSADILSDKKHRIYADCRTVVCYALCRINGITTIDAGRILGRTHCDVVYHLRKAEYWLRMPRLNTTGNAAIRDLQLMDEREKAFKCVLTAFLVRIV